MSDNGEGFFRAAKPTRQQNFSFRNQDSGDLAAEVDGDQSARVHPFPAMLGQDQKVGMPTPGEPASQPGYVRKPDREGVLPTAPSIVRD